MINLRRYAQGLPQWAIFVAFFLLTLFWIALRLPTVPQAIMDADSGHQLAGATQVLYGQHPFVDFEATYGPLVFYASALAQLIFGRRLLGEFVLCALGYALAYGLLALLIRRMNGNLLLGVLAVLALPRLYKYYIVLGPVLVVWFAWRYLRQPRLANIFWLALAVVFTGLFRADLGVYAAIAAIVAVFLKPFSAFNALHRVLILLGAICLFALPWLLFVTWQGGLQRYFYDMVAGGLNIASGMSLGFPAPQFDQPPFSEANLFFLTMLFFVSFPIVFWGFLMLRWKLVEATQRKLLLVVATLYTLSIFQVVSRFDFPHLSQTLPLAFLLVAWMAGELFSPSALTRVWGLSRALAVALCILCIFPALLNGRNSWPAPNLTDLPEKLIQFSQPKDQLLANANTPARYGYVTTMLYLRRCIGDGQFLMALPALTTFPYFTDHPFGGGQIGVVAGYFVTQADQERIVAKMQQQDIPLIVYIPNYAFDNLPTRTLEVSAPWVAKYIKAKYRLLKEVGALNVLLRRDLVIENRVIGLENYSCPVPRR